MTRQKRLSEETIELVESYREYDRETFDDMLRKIFREAGVKKK